VRLGSDCMQERIKVDQAMTNKVVNLRNERPHQQPHQAQKTETVSTIEMVPYSFEKDFALICSIGFNIGFVVALFMLK